MTLEMDIDELNAFLAGAFEGGRPYVVDELADDRCRLVLPAEHVSTRPGGTVAGPVLMMLADAAAYAMVLARIGPVALAVTSSLTISFLRKPEPGVVIAEAAVLKVGRKLAVIEVRLYAGDEQDPVAHATVTYAIPSSASGSTRASGT